MAILGLLTLDTITIFYVDADPSVSGVTAAVGSQAIYQGQLYNKEGTSDTDWALSQPFSNPLTFDLTPGGQSSAADVTGLSFDSSAVRLGIVEGFLERIYTSPDSQVIQRVWLDIGYRAGTSNTWVLAEDLNLDDAGVTFSITSLGQVQYTSSAVSGTLVSDRFIYRVKNY